MTEKLKINLENTLNSIQKNLSSKPIPELLDQFEEAYEQLLIADYLHQRELRRNKMQENVMSSLQNMKAKAPKIEISEEELVAEQTADAVESNLDLTPEIKVVPHPDGPPPMPRDLEGEPTPEVKKMTESVVEEKAKEPVAKPAKQTSIAEKAQAENTKKTLNTSLGSKALAFGLNDRLAFVKHLFEGNSDDFNRVVSQLNTFESWEESNAFINDMIKPDYNWESKGEFEERFITQVKNRFE